MQFPYSRLNFPKPEWFKFGDLRVKAGKVGMGIKPVKQAASFTPATVVVIYSI